MNSIVNKYVRKTNKKLKNRRITREDCDIVGVHIRRTDHIIYEKINGVVPLTGRYFKQAMELYHDNLKHPIFVIVTDDPQWAETELNNFFKVHFTGEGQTEILLLSTCRLRFLLCGQPGLRRPGPRRVDSLQSHRAVQGDIRPLGSHPGRSVSRDNDSL